MAGSWQSREDVLQVLKILSSEVRELDIGWTVQVLESPPSPLQFIRDFISPNKPVIIRGALGEWPALGLWTNDYLNSVMGSSKVTVATTPNGRADAVTPLPKATRDFCGGAAAGPVGDGSEGDCSKTDGACFALSAERPLPDATRGSSGKAAEGDGGCGGATGGAGECFALPAERQMPLRELLASLETKQGHPLYVQQQNGNLTGEFSALLGDVARDIPWATEALGALPEAANLWIGDSRSVTSFHKDHYENLYGVIAGEKIFTLLPPTDVYRMYLGQYPLAKWEEGEGGVLRLELQEPSQSVLWSPVEALGGEGGSEGLEGSGVGVSGGSCLRGEEGSCREAERGSASEGGSGSEGVYGDDPVAGPAADAADAKRAHRAARALQAELYPLFFDEGLPRPLVVRLQPGELLYLPSMWHHSVEQRDGPEGRVIAVNYWYDMKFDSKVAVFNAVESLARIVSSAEPGARTA